MCNMHITEKCLLTKSVRKFRQNKKSVKKLKEKENASKI